jgi:septal ring factor EnvC (AmiA/AmiB activator)
MPDQLQAELQKANDLLAALEAQRNNFANQLAHAQAALAAAQRRINELEAQLAAQPPVSATTPPTPGPTVNGHADPALPSGPTE